MLYELHWPPVQEQITFFSLKKLNYNNSVSLDVYYTSSKPRFQIWSLVFQSFVHLYRAKILKSDHTFPRNENIQKEFGPNKETVNNSHLFILFLTTIKLIISLLSILECPFPSPPLLFLLFIVQPQVKFLFSLSFFNHRTKKKESGNQSFTKKYWASNTWKLQASQKFLRSSLNIILNNTMWPPSENPPLLLAI